MIVMVMVMQQQSEEEMMMMMMRGVKGAKCRAVEEPPAGLPLTDLFPRVPFGPVTSSSSRPTPAASPSLSTAPQPQASVSSRLPPTSLDSSAQPSSFPPTTILPVLSSPSTYQMQIPFQMHMMSTIGREQRIRLWFDPAKDFHDYTFLWTSEHIVFYIDDTPIRELSRTVLQEYYPTKKMFLYGTIWDGSDWATGGGKFKANYTYAPFVAEFSQFILNGCKFKSSRSVHLDHDQGSLADCDWEFNLIPTKLTQDQRRSISWVQQNYMTYNYCDDSQRYPKPLLECSSSLAHEL
ncbi:hypothetical protein L7F22_000676 [Adiantum nelumboides]|nr:hypothetical protein [Adiantum nelumboides]